MLDEKRIKMSVHNLIYQGCTPPNIKTLNIFSIVAWLWFKSDLIVEMGQFGFTMLKECNSREICLKNNIPAEGALI